MRKHLSRAIAVLGAVLAALASRPLSPPADAGELNAGKGTSRTGRVVRSAAIDGGRLLGGYVYVKSADATAVLPEGFQLQEGTGEMTVLAVDVVRYSSASIDGRRLPGGLITLEYLPVVMAPAEHQVEWSALDWLLVRASCSDPQLRQTFAGWNVPSQPALMWQKVTETADAFRASASLASRHLAFSLHASTPLANLFPVPEGGATRTFGVKDGVVANYVSWRAGSFDLYFGSGLFDILWGDFAVPRASSDDAGPAYIPSISYQLHFVPLARDSRFAARP